MPTTENKENTVVNENTCDVEKTREAISDLYKNVTMAQNCVKTLLPYVAEQDVTKALHKQVEQYDSYIEQIGTLGETLNFEPTPAPRALIGMANVGIRAKMIADKSTTHVAKIMLQGTLNGIIDLYRLIKENETVHPEVALLEKQVLRYEEGRFENTKSWL
ncbi:MAG: hypothetical protein NC132_06275 [Corallococcus sp.]|nr:hypothetical protein [Corallococcus sp.]MCM1359785.1 hypothetical protein [Corallococcus sp.]MCM1395689.1 hypothetical protein [Corallococcus sp.]